MSESDSAVSKAAQRLTLLRPLVHPLLVEHLDKVVDFARVWPPSRDFNPTELYYSTQYRMEEAALLSESYTATIFNRAACIGGMAIFFEAFARALSGKQVKRAPSGIADLTSQIWDEFDTAFDACRCTGQMKFDGAL